MKPLFKRRMLPGQARVGLLAYGLSSTRRQLPTGKQRRRTVPQAPLPNRSPNQDQTCPTLRTATPRGRQSPATGRRKTAAHPMTRRPIACVLGAADLWLAGPGCGAFGNAGRAGLAPISQTSLNVGNCQNRPGGSLAKWPHLQAKRFKLSCSCFWVLQLCGLAEALLWRMVLVSLHNGWQLYAGWHSLDCGGNMRAGQSVCQGWQGLSFNLGGRVHRLGCMAQA